MKQVEIKPWMCYNCGYFMNTSWNKKDVLPKPGDLTVCFNCGYLMKFDDELKFVEMTNTEIDTALTNKVVRHMIQNILARGPLEEHGGHC